MASIIFTKQTEYVSCENMTVIVLQRNLRINKTSHTVRVDDLNFGVENYSKSNEPNRHLQNISP